MTEVPTLAAEQAAALLMHELAGYRRRARSEARHSVGRLLLGRPGSGTLPLPYSTIVTLVSIAEGFYAVTLRTQVESAFDMTTQLMKDASRDAARSMDNTWSDRMKQAKRWFGIDGQAENSVGEMLIFAEARNAVAHGLGELTGRQRGNDNWQKVITDLNSVGVQVTGLRLNLDGDAVERCARSCRQSVLWLDRESSGAVPLAATVT